MSTIHNWNPSPIMKQLRRDEGFRLAPYADSTGNLTIGVGRNLTSIGISAEEAEYLLGNDIYRAIAGINKFIPWAADLDDARYGAIINLTFNVGIGGVMNFEHFLAFMKERDWPNAAKEMLNSKWAEQVGLRAQRLAVQVETGIWQ